MKKSLATVMAVAALSVVCSFSAWAVEGWENRGGDWYYYEPGTGMLVTGWKEIDGKWYYLDQDGRMATDPVLLVPDRDGALQWPGMAEQ